MPTRIPLIVALAVLIASPALADDITDAMDQARKAYQAGDLGQAKQSLDMASQLIGQKNAEAFATLLPNALPGWKAEKVQTTALGAAGFGASTASRSYNNPKGDRVEVQISGDSAIVSQIATFLNNPAMAGAMGGSKSEEFLATAEHGEDSRNSNPHAWYIAFSTEADVAVAVLVENGGNAGQDATGGSVAAPIGRAVIHAAEQEQK